MQICYFCPVKIYLRLPKAPCLMDLKMLTEDFPPHHKAGYISIIGKPNAGKSTLLNVLLGEKLAIATAKAQTTRHRIMGIINAPDYQIIYSDTPGIIEQPKYKLHERMMTYVKESLSDSDALIFLADAQDEWTKDQELVSKLSSIVKEKPIILLVNKIDLVNQEFVTAQIKKWTELVPFTAVSAISALHQFNLQNLLDTLLQYLPVHPPYFSKDAFTDRPERFFASEIIREQIFLHYEQEIPYCSEVRIVEFKDKIDILAIRAEIFVERTSQKGIFIGHKGEMIKKVGIAARLELEKFFGKKVFLEQHVKVEPDWRTKQNSLDKFGYDQ